MFNPSRSKRDLIVRSQAPYNAEPRLHRLRSAFITALPDFYVRCHGNIPQLDGTRHRLRVDGRVATPLDLSMSEPRARFPQRTVTAVMQRAGNRRGDMGQVRSVSGDPWAAGARQARDGRGAGVGASQTAGCSWSMLRLTKHAEQHVTERGLRLAWIEAAIPAPDWVEADEDQTLAHSFKTIAENGNRVLNVLHRSLGTAMIVATAYFERGARR
jgi:DMSO/TMAO reductase YedYZ molybdopterin-dependent catalytic subunit